MYKSNYITTKIVDIDKKNSNLNKPNTKTNTTSAKNKKQTNKNISNNKLPHAGIESFIALSVITGITIVLSKKSNIKKTIKE